MKKPGLVLLIAETKCCGYRQVVNEVWENGKFREKVGHPRHPEKVTGKLVECEIVRVWEFEARRLHIVKAML